MAVETAITVECYVNFCSRKAEGMRRQQNRFWAEINAFAEAADVTFTPAPLRLVPRVEEDAA